MSSRLTTDQYVLGNSYHGSNYTNVNSASYTQLDTDQVLGVSYTSTGAVAITLLEISAMALPRRRRITIVDIGNNSATNNITVSGGGSDTILGAGASFVIDDSGASVTLMNDGASQWFLAA